MNPENMLCPLCDEIIDNGDCFENCAVADKELKPDTMPQKFKQKDNWCEICLNCQYHIE